MMYLFYPLRRVRDVVGRSDASMTYEQLARHLPSKVKRMVEVLKRFKPEERKKLKNGTEENMAALVFVEQRYVAYVMKVFSAQFENIVC